RSHSAWARLSSPTPVARGGDHVWRARASPEPARPDDLPAAHRARHRPSRRWPFREGAAVCNKAIQSNPRFSFPRVLQTAALSCLGRSDEAKIAARRVFELEPHFSISVFVRSHTGRPEIWTPIGEALRRVGFPD